MKEVLGGVRPSNYHLTALRRLRGLYSWWDTNNEGAPDSLRLTVALVCISEAQDGRVAGLFVYSTGKEAGEYYRVGMWLEKLEGEGTKHNGFSRDWPTETITLV